MKTKKTTEFKDLWLGDRFIYNGITWTKIGKEEARKHSTDSIELGVRGVGYKDSICSFLLEDIVEFLPVLSDENKSNDEGTTDLPKSPLQCANEVIEQQKYLMNRQSELIDVAILRK